MADKSPRGELISDAAYAAAEERRVASAGPGRLRIFLTVFLVVGLLGLAYTFVRPAVYRSTAILVGAAPGPGVENDREARSENLVRQREVLLSRSMMENLLTALDRGNLPQAGRPRTVDALYDMLEAIPLGEAGILELRAEGPHAAVLPGVVNTWVDVYLAAQASSGRAESDSVGETLRRQRDSLAQKVEIKRQQLTEFRQEHNIDSLQREENRALKKLRGLTDALNKANEEEVTAAARLTAMRKALAAGKPVVRIEDERTLANLEQRAVDLREQLRDYEQRFTPAYMEINPKIKTLQRNLEKVEQNIAEKRQQAQELALTEAEQTLSSARETSLKLRRQLDDYQQTVAAFTARFAEHTALQEDLAELEQLYRDVQQRLVETEVLNAAQSPKMELLERAFAPERPIRPLYLRDAAISVAGAFVLGLLAIWLYEFITRKEAQPAAAHAQPVFYSITQQSPPVSELPLPRGQAVPAIGQASPRELAESEVAALLHAGNAATRPLMMALLSGVHTEEASTLQWSDIDTEKRELRVSGHAPRIIELPAPLCDALRTMQTVDTAPDARVWRDREGQSLDAAALSAMVETAAHDAGLTNPTEVDARALRHTYLAFLVRQGIRLADLERIAGPIPPTELAAYGRLSPPGPGIALEDTERFYSLLR